MWTYKKREKTPPIIIQHAPIDPYSTGIQVGDVLLRRVTNGWIVVYLPKSCEQAQYYVAGEDAGEVLRVARHAIVVNKLTPG